MTETVLDLAHKAMETAPDDDHARLRFYERLADAELFVLQDSEYGFSPRVFPLEDGPVVLAFDREDRLAEFAQGPASCAEMTGRTLVPLLAEARLGLGLNLGVAPSAFHMPHDAVVWLSETLAKRPESMASQPEAVEPPTDVPEAVILALDAKFCGLAGLAQKAFLATAVHQTGRRVPLVAFDGWVPGAEDALSGAVSEALIFSGQDSGAMDVAFPKAGGALLDRLSKVALRFDLPAAETPSGPSAPGTDPAKPPKLR